MLLPPPPPPAPLCPDTSSCGGGHRPAAPCGRGRAGAAAAPSEMEHPGKSCAKAQQVPREQAGAGAGAGACRTGLGDMKPRVFLKAEREEEVCGRAVPEPAARDLPDVPGWSGPSHEIEVKLEPDDDSYPGYPQDLEDSDDPAYPSVGIKPEVVVKMEPEDDSYGECSQSYGGQGLSDDPYSCDGNPEIIVKVEPDEESYIGYPQGLGEGDVPDYAGTGPAPMAPMLPRPAVPLDPEYEGSEGARRKRLKEEMLEELVAASAQRARAAEEWRARVEFHQERCADLVSRGIAHARRAARRQERKISAAMREAAAAAREVMELLRENLDFEREMQRSMLGLLSRQTACIEAALQRPFPGACHGAGEPPRHTTVP